MLRLNVLGKKQIANTIYSIQTVSDPPNLYIIDVNPEMSIAQVSEGTICKLKREAVSQLTTIRHGSIH